MFPVALIVLETATLPKILTPVGENTAIFPTVLTDIVKLALAVEYLNYFRHLLH